MITHIIGLILLNLGILFLVWLITTTGVTITGAIKGDAFEGFVVGFVIGCILVIVTFIVSIFVWAVWLMGGL